MFDKNLVLVSGAFVFKEGEKGLRWLLVKNNDADGWEIPKVVVRKVESSVRAALRIMGEQGGMSVRVIEEVGRAGGVTTVNGKVLPQRHIYYLLRQKASGGEIIGFAEFEWLDFSRAVRKLKSKREAQMLRIAKKEYGDFIKRRRARRRAQALVDAAANRV